MQKRLHSTSIGFLVLAITLPLFIAGPALADSAPAKIHFLIPGGAGGGWDGTARGVGKALVG